MLLLGEIFWEEEACSSWEKSCGRRHPPPGECSSWEKSCGRRHPPPGRNLLGGGGMLLLGEILWREASPSWGTLLLEMVTGELEGTAKALDPDFKVVESAYPFVIGRLLADPTPDMSRILMELIIRSDGSIRWNWLERLIAAISEQASESASEATKPEDKSLNPLGWKSFDMRDVVSATKGLFQFILSDKGLRVRIFLARDITQAADIFLEDEVVEWIFNDKAQSRNTSEPEEFYYGNCLYVLKLVAQSSLYAENNYLGAGTGFIGAEPEFWLLEIDIWMPKLLI
ncbi:hypothetical protein RHMOL_Rhmol07G0214700 [Rhododendron molle]|uniref:Uncharacterized protein n=1 Tax=Rhododendron molle TaxID=49168 RepID=A0ACC0N4U2_RHOML|nr:hypothetical protein RHMOL_Rhmol07G0214700 [Rhododendron molle]